MTTREEADEMLADVMAEHFERLRANLESHIDRAIAARALPPFVPPPAWTAGRHGAGIAVRHRNGIFMARRDTAAEPGLDDAWLPLLVGVADLEVKWDDERTISLRAVMSDGAVIEASNSFAVPISRGYWEAETDYKPGDRVSRFGEWESVVPSRGLDPNTPEGAEHWRRVGQRERRAPLSLAIDNEGTMTEGGQTIGSIKPLMTRLLADLVAGHTTKQ